jgi:uncharacterized protein YgfB (UPF0149 family)
MSIMKLPDFDQYTETLEAIGGDCSASESHGILCGLLCTNKTAEVKAKWVNELLPDELSEQNRVVQDFDDLADQTYQETIRQLNHETLDFHLLLPTEDEDISFQIEALAKWCQGFIYGLGLGGYKESTTSGSDVIELIRDFSEIAKAGCTDEEANDEEEAAYMEVEEYVRVGVLLIMEELQPVKLQQPIVH